jgi:hypothetical protein
MKKLALAGAAVIAMACVAGFQAVEAPSVKVWEGSDGNRVDLVGVCDVNERGVRCWDPNGADDAALASRFAERARSDGDANLRFTYGHKNRWAVLQVTGDAEVRTRSGWGTWVWSGDNPAGSGTKLAVAQVVAPSDAEQGSVSIQVGSVTGSPVVVRARAGETANVGGALFQIVQVGESSWSMRFPGAFEWTESKSCFVIAGSDVATRPDPAFVAAPLDSEGREILYVDSKGHPVGSKNSHTGPDATNKDEAVTYQCDSPYMEVPEVCRMFFNLDRRSLAYLRVKREVWRTVLVSRIPLDPAQ